MAAIGHDDDILSRFVYCITSSAVRVQDLISQKFSKAKLLSRQGLCFVVRYGSTAYTKSVVQLRLYLNVVWS